MEIKNQKTIKGCAIAYLVFKILFALFFVTVIGLAGVSTALSMRCQVSKEPVDFLGRKVLLVYSDMGMSGAAPKYSLLLLKEAKLEDLQYQQEGASDNSVVVYYDNKNFKLPGLVAQRIYAGEVGTDLQFHFTIKGDDNAEVNQHSVVLEGGGTAAMQIQGVLDRKISLTRWAMLGVTNIWFLIFVLLLPALALIVLQLTGISEPLSVRAAFKKKRDFEEEFQETGSLEPELTPEVIERVRELLSSEQKTEGDGAAEEFQTPQSGESGAQALPAKSPAVAIADGSADDKPTVQKQLPPKKQSEQSFPKSKKNYSTSSHRSGHGKKRR